jgi:hypothetical protein
VRIHLLSRYFIVLGLLSLLNKSALSQPVVQGPGCTTATVIDWDCDGYGPGSPLGPDADDNDANVNTPASAVAKYGSTGALLAHLAYTPLRMLFISPSGNDSTGQPNNESLPYASWNGLSGVVQPGDAVIWRAGTYTMSSPIYVKAGTAAHPTLYMAYPGEKVVLDWSACNNSGAGCTGFIANDLSYWTMDGLVLNGGNGGYGIDEQGYQLPINVTLRNIEVIGWYDGLFLMNGITNILIEHSYFHDLYIYGEHNMYLGGNPNNNPNTVIRNNIIAKAGVGGGHNIHLNGQFSNAYIGGNILYGALNEALGLQQAVNNSLFENNIVFTTTQAAVFFYDYGDQSDPDIIARDQNYNVFRNNTFYYDGGDYYTASATCTQQIAWFADLSGSTCVKNGGTCSGLTCSGGTGGSCNYSNTTNASHDLGHNTFDNNLLVVGCTGPWATQAAFRFDTDINGAGGLAWLQTDTFRNNIVYINGTYQYNFLVSNDFTDSENYNSATLTIYSFAQFESMLGAGLGTNLQSNPMLVAANPNWYNTPQNFNLRVQAGSPAIGAALAADAAATDITGKSRGSAPDIGAYQYGGSSTAIALAINTTVLSGGTIGALYSQGLSASGGTAPYSWSLTSGSLPSGLVLSSTGLISGTPLTAGTSTVAVMVQDSAGASLSATWSITIVSVAPGVSSVSCPSIGLSSNGALACTVTLSAPAPAGGTSVALTSSNTLLSLPSFVTVAAGATSATFTVTAGTVSFSQAASATATLNGNSQSASISLTASAPALSSLNCAASSLTSGASTTCTVTLSVAPPPGGATVTLASSSALLVVPSSLTVPAGASAASFAATAGIVSASVPAAITATLAGASTTANLTLQPATSGATGSSSSDTLVIQGTRSEVSATSNGAVVTPTTAPAGLRGRLVVRGSGSVNYATNGVSFKTGGQQNGDTAFYSFKGSQVQNVLNVSQGQISFNLTSSYNFAARQQLPQYSYRDVFDGFDNSQELFIFQVQAEYGRLIFYYNTGGTSAQWYWVPVGTEDTLFGQGTTVQVKMVWNAGTLNLYLNGTLVNTNSYQVATPNWTSSSSFTFGANDVHVYSGGYFSCDDVIAGFQLQNVAPSGTN